MRVARSSHARHSQWRVLDWLAMAACECRTCLSFDSSKLGHFVINTRRAATIRSHRNSNFLKPFSGILLLSLASQIFFCHSFETLNIPMHCSGIWVPGYFEKGDLPEPLARSGSLRLVFSSHHVMHLLHESKHTKHMTSIFTN